MEAAARIVHANGPAVVFEDGLGQRFHLDDPGGRPGAEALVLRGSFAAVPSFEFALRERAGRLATFRHAYYARVRGVERGAGVEPALRIVSDAGQGIRLSELLKGAQARRVPIDINAALCLVRQLVPAVAMLHESARDVAHGAIGPERLMVTPHARLLILEHVLGAALEQLRYPRERYWSELRIAVPGGSIGARFDHRSDVLQIGIVALSLILGRQLRTEEFPDRIGDVVASTWAVSPRGGFEPLPPGLRGWLARALQIDPARSFQSAVEARAELDAVLGDTDLVASPASLESFLARYHSIEVPAPDVRLQPSLVPAAAAAPPPPVADVAPARPIEPRPTPVQLHVRDDRSRDASTPTVDLMPMASPVALPPAPAPVEPVADEGEVAPIEDDEVGFGDDDRRWWRNWRLIGAGAVVTVVLVAGASFATRRPATAAEPPVRSGTLEIATDPPGADALVDGTLRGSTPLELALDPGAHRVELRGGGEVRSIPITIASGMKVSQYVELSRGSGDMQAARVDGAPKPGATPTATGETPKEPVVAHASTGWVAVSSPFDVQLFEGGELIGTGRDRTELGAGRHQIEIVNADLGIRTPAVANVTAGKTTTLQVQRPNGTVSLNAAPWAEVWLDGEKIGETPIGNFAVAVGTHDLVFRHPELGERHATVTVTTKAPARLSIDFNAR